MTCSSLGLCSLHLSSPWFSIFPVHKSLEAGRVDYATQSAGAHVFCLSAVKLYLILYRARGKKMIRSFTYRKWGTCFLRSLIKGQSCGRSLIQGLRTELSLFYHRTWVGNHECRCSEHSWDSRPMPFAICNNGNPPLPRNWPADKTAVCTGKKCLIQIL